MAVTRDVPDERSVVLGHRQTRGVVRRLCAQGGGEGGAIGRCRRREGANEIEELRFVGGPVWADESHGQRAIP